MTLADRFPHIEASRRYFPSRRGKRQNWTLLARVENLA
jgi:hypothetical protein